MNAAQTAKVADARAVLAQLWNSPDFAES